jgi:hypothetical protein
LNLEDGNQVRLTSGNLRVTVDPQMRDRLDDLLSPGQYRLITARPAPSASTPTHPRRMAAVS